VFFKGGATNEFKIPPKYLITLVIYIVCNLKSTNSSVHEHVKHRQTTKFRAHKIKWLYSNLQILSIPLIACSRSAGERWREQRERGVHEPGHRQRRTHPAGDQPGARGRPRPGQRRLTPIQTGQCPPGLMYFGHTLSVGIKGLPCRLVVWRTQKVNLWKPVFSVYQYIGGIKSNCLVPLYVLYQLALCLNLVIHLLLWEKNCNTKQLRICCFLWVFFYINHLPHLAITCVWFWKAELIL